MCIGGRIPKVVEARIRATTTLSPDILPTSEAQEYNLHFSLKREPLKVGVEEEDRHAHTKGK